MLICKVYGQTELDFGQPILWYTSINWRKKSSSMTNTTLITDHIISSIPISQISVQISLEQERLPCFLNGNKSSILSDVEMQSFFFKFFISFLAVYWARGRAAPDYDPIHDSKTKESNMFIWHIWVHICFYVSYSRKLILLGLKFWEWHIFGRKGKCVLEHFRL